MSNIIIGQKRKWNKSGYIFTIIKKDYNDYGMYWILMYEDDGRKQTQDENTIKTQSIIISN